MLNNHLSKHINSYMYQLDFLSDTHYAKSIRQKIKSVNALGFTASIALISEHSKQFSGVSIYLSAHSFILQHIKISGYLI